MGIEKKSVIISIQSTKGDPTDNEICKKAYFKSAIKGGARGFRLAGVEDIILAKKMFPDIPVIGITKPEVIPENYKELVYITPSVEDAKSLIDAGADIIAFDATRRHNYEDILDVIKKNNKLAMADISDFEEGILANELGCDFISTTLSGYTTYSKQSDEPDFELVQKLAEKNIKVIAEGKIWEREQVKKAFNCGAYSVVIGSSVTRPWLIVERFVNYG
ncbi:MAG: putative N-acetylmannosamine-6-phosphate 2-epimerase [Cyanobacteria bacterium SIG30]|nr:putative N-acetylmannosamine-6-phosphate 2-epimerase [Cyanobacteria bacterium SIG30]